MRKSMIKESPFCVVSKPKTCFDLMELFEGWEEVEFGVDVYVDERENKIAFSGDNIILNNEISIPIPDSVQGVINEVSKYGVFLKINPLFIMCKN